MDISVTEAEGQLQALIDKAVNGDQVVLTRHGLAVARLVPEKPPRSRHDALMAARGAGKNGIMAGETAAQIESALYGVDGLPA